MDSITNNFFFNSPAFKQKMQIIVCLTILVFNKEINRGDGHCDIRGKLTFTFFKNYYYSDFRVMVSGIATI